MTGGEIVMRRFAIYVLLLILAVSAKAQFDTATVLGTVTDPSAAVVARCHVALRNTATAEVQTALTDEQGQFRAEAFNLTNESNFGDPNTLLGSTFGLINSALPARELQVAGKITF